MPMSIFALLVIPNFNQFLPADGVCPMAHRSALWWGLSIQLHGVEGQNKFPVTQSQNWTFRKDLKEILWKCTVHCLLLTLWNSVDAGGFRESKGHQPWLQHQWWDLWGGDNSLNSSNLFNPLYFTVPLYWLKNDWKPLQVPLFCTLCEVPAPVRKVTVRGLCELSIFDKWSHSILATPQNDHIEGCTTTSSERMGDRCTLGIGTLSSTTTPPSPPGCGTTGRTTEAWPSVFLQSRRSF